MASCGERRTTGNRPRRCMTTRPAIRSGNERIGSDYGTKPSFDVRGLQSMKEGYERNR